MADEPRLDRRSTTIAALCWPARSRADCGPFLIPGGRSARGRRARHAACRKAAPKERQWQQAARRVPRLFAPFPRASNGSLRPITGPRYRKSRAWVRGHARARPRRAPPARSAARLEGARSGDNRVIAPCPRRSRPPAPPRPGWTARRARRAWHSWCTPPDRQHHSRQAHAAPSSIASESLAHTLDSRAHDLHRRLRTARHERHLG
jgi:hypothetical protein